MGAIYVGQDFKITLNLNEDITGYLTVKIAFKKQNGSTGEWVATVEDAVLGKISYNVLAAENNSHGKLTCWARVTDAQGLYYPSTPSTFSIRNEGL